METQTEKTEWVFPCWGKSKMNNLVYFIENGVGKRYVKGILIDSKNKWDMNDFVPYNSRFKVIDTKKEEIKEQTIEIDKEVEPIENHYEPLETIRVLTGLIKECSTNPNILIHEKLTKYLNLL